MYNVQCTVYSIQCIFGEYTVYLHCTMYIQNVQIIMVIRFSLGKFWSIIVEEYVFVLGNICLYIYIYIYSIGIHW